MRVSCLSLVLTFGAVSALYLTSSDLAISGKERNIRDVSRCGPNDTVPPNRVNTTIQVALVRAEMAKLSLDALVVPLDGEGRVDWLSGFSGSNAEVVLTMDSALLWTDGRYFIQASDQMDCQWTLMKMNEADVPTLGEWVAAMGPGKVVGSDPLLVGTGIWLDWEETMALGGVTLKEVANLIDLVWTEEGGRPPPLVKNLVIQDMRFAGETWQSKVGRAREELAKRDLFGMVITERDEVAWLLNLRGEGTSHLEGLFHSPTFQSMILVTMDSIFLWLHMDKVTPEIIEHLVPEGCEEDNTCVHLMDIQQCLAELGSMVGSLQEGQMLLVTKPSTYLTGASYAVFRTVGEAHRKLDDSPILDMKAIKNPVEEAGMLDSHVRDCAALCDWAAMMEEQVEVNGARNWTEISAAEKLAEYRMKLKDNKGLSFSTISAFGSNGAIIHYSATPETDAQITADSLFMVDSGGQFLDGTTDITRTFHYGHPTQEMIDRYTDVLKGAIELARVIMPDGSFDTSIDLATRQFLFRNGLNYRHGTGHGIGAYLEVHEGPINIGMGKTRNNKFRAGMFFSDEPGYYEEGKFGLRLETIMRVVKANTSTEYGDFLRFEPVDFVPFEPKLIRYSRLSPEEISWLNDYNQRCMDLVAPRLEGNARALAWMEARTAWIDPKVSYAHQS